VRRWLLTRQSEFDDGAGGTLQVTYSALGMAWLSPNPFLLHQYLAVH
jgi:hypothetical protein